MKKSPFFFDRRQRRGIFLLILLLVIVYGIYFYLVHRPAPSTDLVVDEQYEATLDSLLAEKQRRKDTIYPFNPNYLTDYRGYRLGLSVEQLDRLYRFRESGKWVNSAKEFQNVTGVSDQWLDSISPYFKFPAWVTQKKKLRYNQSRRKQPVNLNLATRSQLQEVYGIGPALSKRIIDERERLGEFRDFMQVRSLYGLTDSTMVKLKERVYLPKKNFPKLSLNNATRDELLSIPYFNDYLVDQLIDQRTLREGFSNWQEVMKTSRFPEEKLALIQLYLKL